MASGLMMQLQSPPQPQQPRSHEQPSMAEQQAPSPQHRDPVPSCVRPKLAAAQVVSELAEVHFSVRSAARNGDCLPLSAMAGFEISRDEALSPTKEAVADVLSLRNRAVELVTSEGSSPCKGGRRPQPSRARPAKLRMLSISNV